MRGQTTHPTKVFIALAFLCLGVKSGPAHAETAREKAVKMLKEGSDLYNKKDHKGALDRFLRAYQLFPSFKIHFNLAMVYDDMDQQEKAARHFELFLKGEKVASPGLVKIARSRFSVLRQRLASVTLSCAEQGASVVVDDKVVGKTPLETKLYLSPGKHKIEITKEGFKTLVLDHQRPYVAGVHQRREVHLQQFTPVVAPAPADADVLAQKRKTKTIFAYTFLATSIACGVAAGVLYGVGFSQGSEAQDRYLLATSSGPPSAGADLDAIDDDKASARTKLIVGNVLAGAAAVSLGVSLYFLLTRPQAPVKEAASARFNVDVYDDGAGLTFSGTF